MSGRVLWDVDTQVDFMLPEGKLYVPGAVETALVVQSFRPTAAAVGVVIASGGTIVDKIALTLAPGERRRLTLIVTQRTEKGFDAVEEHAHFRHVPAQ